MVISKHDVWQKWAEHSTFSGSINKQPPLGKGFCRFLQEKRAASGKVEPENVTEAEPETVETSVAMTRPDEPPKPAKAVPPYWAYWLPSRVWNITMRLMGKLTISIAIFNSKLLNYQRVPQRVPINFWK